MFCYLSQVFQKIFTYSIYIPVFEVCVVNVDLCVFIVMSYGYQFLMITFQEVFLWNGNAVIFVCGVTEAYYNGP